jgi:oligopeptide transport system substrate-binding protein
VAKAKAELAASGLEQPLSMTLELILPNWDKQQTLAQFIQDQLKKHLGINVTLQAFDHKTFRAQLDLHLYPMYEASWSADYPDPDNILSVYLGTSGNNRSTWKNEKYDDLVLQSRAILNPKVREKNYLAAQKILLEDEAVMIPLYYEPNMAMVRSNLQGLELNPINYLLLKKVNVR